MSVSSVEFLSCTDSNRFNKKLKDTEAIERDKVVLEVELQDQTAEAVWSFNGTPIVPDERYGSLLWPSFYYWYWIITIVIRF